MAKYVGWMRCENVDVTPLRKLGMEGEMRTELSISFCEAPNAETIEKLSTEPSIGNWGAHFTAVDEDDKPLPGEQPYRYIGPLFADLREELKRKREQKQSPPATEAKKHSWSERWRAFFSKGL